MRIDIQSQGFELAREERAHLVGRMREALVRFRHRLVGVTVHLRDINGPRGGADKNCQILLHGHDGTTVINDRGRQVAEVFKRSMHRALHALRRKSHRREGDATISHRRPHLAGRNRRLTRAIEPLVDDSA